MNKIVPIANANGELIEKVILGNDLSGLSPIEKVQHVKNICQTLGLNPITKPIALMKFQGKEIPYVTRDGAEQLRKINKVSINKIDTQVHDGGLYVVTASASLPDGRTDSSTGAVSLGGLKGSDLANALMKAETKAKRRVTLSICGLGFISEEEVESLNGAVKIQVDTEKQLIQSHPSELDEMREEFDGVTTLDELEKRFFELLPKYKNNPASREAFITLKNALKIGLQFNADMDEIELKEGDA